MNKQPLMKCGHTALATDSNNRPVCPICAGITTKAYEVETSPPDLTGREAVCIYCKERKPSDTQLPFFEHRPGEAEDHFYNGCRGWE